MKIIKDEYGYIFKDEDASDAADATAFAVAYIKKPITNADRIRSMNDEELAEYLIADIEAEAVRRAGLVLTSGEINRAIVDCLSWLKREAE